MNSSQSECLWPEVVGAHEASLHASDSTQLALCQAVAVDILTAIGTGAFTSSTNVTSELSVDVQYVMALLNQANYTAHNDGTSIVVAW